MGRSTSGGDSLNSQANESGYRKIASNIAARLSVPINSQVEQIRRQLGRLFTHAVVKEYDLEQVFEEPFIFGALLPWEPLPLINEDDQFIRISSAIESAQLPSLQLGGNGIDLTYIHAKVFSGEMGSDFICETYDTVMAINSIYINNLQLEKESLKNISTLVIDTSCQNTSISSIEFGSIDKAVIKDIQIEDYKKRTINKFDISMPEGIKLESITIGSKQLVHTFAFCVDGAARNLDPRFKKRLDPLRKIVIPVRKHMGAIYKVPLVRKSIAGKRGAATKLDEK